MSGNQKVLLVIPTLVVLVLVVGIVYVAVIRPARRGRAATTPAAARTATVLPAATPVSLVLGGDSS